MGSRASWIALGVGAYLAFVISQFPAATAYRWFAPDTVRLAGIEGTVWSGRAATGALGGLALGDLRWTFSGWSLLILRLAGQFEARLPDGLARGLVRIAPSGVELRELRASTSLPTLQSVLPVKGTNGLASLALDRLRLESGWPTAIIGELRLMQLEVAPIVPTGEPGMIALGDYQVQFEDSAGQGLIANFRDIGGPLEVSGTILLDRDRAYALDGYVRPRSNASRALVQGLEIMTSDPDGSGRRNLTLTGRL